MNQQFNNLYINVMWFYSTDILGQIFMIIENDYVVKIMNISNMIIIILIFGWFGYPILVFRHKNNFEIKFLMLKEPCLFLAIKSPITHPWIALNQKTMAKCTSASFSHELLFSRNHSKKFTGLLTSERVFKEVVFCLIEHTTHVNLPTMDLVPSTEKITAANGPAEILKGVICMV